MTTHWGSPRHTRITERFLVYHQEVVPDQLTRYNNIPGRRTPGNVSKQQYLLEMATGVDQAAGMSLVVFSLLLFTYYSVWVIVLPFVDSDHVLHKYFLPREYSVILPGIAAVILLLCIGAFTAVIMWKNRKPKKAD
ncbi:dolichol phosphate-mannose biosynthesis regulatory protein [Scomber scombrus]|uniref:Dolichol phosphate-mannose biosynthesis regulatory protein n=1 Tax=Scomber scombrus TaxID=13677 RepID=A0AAV1Q1C4_SCOSC